jgi:HSP20 family protein
MNALMKKNDFWGIFFPDFFETFSMELDKLNYDYPKVNTFEDDNNFRVDVFYPGMKKENFKIKVENKSLRISSDFSESKEEGSEKYHFKEFSKGKFEKRFTLPDEIIKDKIKASYEDGVLKIFIPKDKTKEKQSNFEVSIE